MAATLPAQQQGFAAGWHLSEWLTLAGKTLYYDHALRRDRLGEIVADLNRASDEANSANGGGMCRRPKGLKGHNARLIARSASRAGTLSAR